MYVYLYSYKYMYVRMCFSKERKIYNKTIMVIQYKLMFVVKKSKRPKNENSINGKKIQILQ